MIDSKLETIAVGREKFKAISFCLTERSRRLWGASEAKSYGWGGITVVSEATGMDHKTIRKGLLELKTKEKMAADRIRKPGGGGKKLTHLCPHILNDLESLVDPLSRGDRESALRWICKSSYTLAEELTHRGYDVSQRTVCNLLSELGYSLQANKKTKEGASHGDRNAQFEHINQEAQAFQGRGQPVVSVDTKKKEHIGNYKNRGREYRPKGKPREVNGHDFPDKKLGKVAPYGGYDIFHNRGWVSVGISHDRAQFAVNAIPSWWTELGKPLYPIAQEMLITADCGGSNGYRVRLWKVELQKLANELGLTISVCHFPPGTSKWNKIEHRMFSTISENWRGRPLITRETVVSLIGHTKTKTGLEIKSKLDETIYQKGIKVTDEEMNNINIEKAEFHGEWNYTISPQRSK